MSYPFSIEKEVVISNDEAKYSLNIIKTDLKNELKKINKSKISIKNNTIIAENLVEFSSGNTNLQVQNKGNFELTEGNNTIKIKCKIIVWEHFIIFNIISILSLFILYNFKTFDYSISIGLPFILYFSIFVFFYLMPKMTFDFFIKKWLSKYE